MDQELQGRIPPWIGFRCKTLWGWLQLLGTLAGLDAIAFGIITFNIQRATERQLETDRAREAALQAYLDRMTDLLLDDSLRELPPTPGQYPTHDILSGSSLRTQPQAFARAHTLATLPSLDANRQKVILRFLHDSALIRRDFKVVTIEPFPLPPSPPRLAILQDAELSGADLSGGDLDLPDVNLHGAELVNTNLSEVRLRNADLSNTLLINANLTNSILESADLCGAQLMNADLRNADLRMTLLLNADLSSVDLRNANLGGAKLGDARVLEDHGGCSSLAVIHLASTNLRNANLNGTDLTNEQLAQVHDLVGATMPDGTIMSGEHWEDFKVQYRSASP
jgi:uncharacterized protein YjbI with pentapeptide repeats